MFWPCPRAIFLAVVLFGFSPGPKFGAWVNGWQSNSRVCFISFDIPLYLPHTEESIQADRLCEYSIDTSTFIGMLTPSESGSSYLSGDIRAMVGITPTMNLFVDRCGLVRAGTKYYKLDKDRLMNQLDGLRYKPSDHGYPPYPSVAPCGYELQQ